MTDRFHKKLKVERDSVGLSLLRLDHSNKKFCNASKSALSHFLSLFFQNPNRVTVTSRVLTSSDEGMLTKDLLASKLKSFYTTETNIHYTQRTFMDYMRFLKEFRQIK